MDNLTICPMYIKSLVLWYFVEVSFEDQDTHLRFQTNIYLILFLNLENAYAILMEDQTEKCTLIANAWGITCSMWLANQGAQWIYCIKFSSLCQNFPCNFLIFDFEGRKFFIISKYVHKPSKKFLVVPTARTVVVTKRKS